MTLEQIKAMSAAEVAECLVEYQKWRKGQHPYAYGDGSKYPFSDGELGLIIDRAVKILKEVEDGKTDK